MPIKMSRDGFFEAAGVADPDAEGKLGGISTGAKIGIAIGAMVAAAMALAGLIIFFRCRKSRREMKNSVEPKRWRIHTQPGQRRRCSVPGSLVTKPLGVGIYGIGHVTFDHGRQPGASVGRDDDMAMYPESI
ncbi:hypothetical protein RJ55_02722 [Drechmeria coniospora]|nr:hypothetical protein RJ55_02722 [Drechmeria coniospora]